MLNLKSDREATNIVKNVVKACSNIDKLSKAGYDFLMLSSGFIAHYDIHGFKATYEEHGKLASRIIQCEKDNQWLNFRPGDTNYEYYKQKADMYKAICKQLAYKALQ